MRVIVTSVQDMGIHLTPAKGRVQGLMCRWTDRIVANADAVRQRLIADGYDPARITVIRSGVDVARFTNKTAGRGIRQALGLPPGSPLVAVLSRVDRIKGIEYFLEAMATMADRFKDVHFLIVGDTGSGKSSVIRQMLYQVETRGDSAIVYDPATKRVFTMNGHSGDTTAINAANGTVFPSSTSNERSGVTESCSSVPTSRSRTTASAVCAVQIASTISPSTPGIW